MPTATESELVERARQGGAGAFGQLVKPHVGVLRGLIARLVLHPQDTEDLTQEALLSAHQKLDSYRGEARFRTWLLAIGARKSIDLLRRRKRWPVDAQSIAAAAHYRSPELLQQIGRAASAQGFEYDYREHIAYCFSCIGRALPPQQAAALLLREVFEFTNEEAANTVGLSLSSFRHRLAEARAFMKDTFEGTCALVGKQGVCWQCQGLRDNLPEDTRGAAPAAISLSSDAEEKFKRRLAIVRETKFGSGEATSQSLHDYITRYMASSFDA